MSVELTVGCGDVCLAGGVFCYRILSKSSAGLADVCGIRNGRSIICLTGWAGLLVLPSSRLTVSWLSLNWGRVIESSGIVVLVVKLTLLQLTSVTLLGICRSCAAATVRNSFRVSRLPVVNMVLGWAVVGWVSRCLLVICLRVRAR